MNAKTGRSQTPGAVLYTRVSTGEQEKHGTSPETQKDACRAKALSLSLRVASEYHDGGISGGLLLARPGMQAALADIRAGRADTLICYSLSRYSRDVEHQQAIKKAVKAAGGRIVFCDADFDDTAAGELNFTIQGGFAEYERKIIRERCMAGHRRRAKNGIQTARVTAPYGYIVPKNADILRGTYPAALLGKYLIAEEQAAVVRQVFARYAGGGESLSGLCRWLNQRGVPTAGRAASWGVSVLQYLLQNPVYKGVAAYGRFSHSTEEGRLGQASPQTGRPYLTLKVQRPAAPETWLTWDVPALVSEAVWEAVQARLTGNRARLSGNPQQVRMLTGRVVCPECGTAMACSSPGTRRRKDGTAHLLPPRYICRRYRETLKRTGAGECEPDGYNVPDVEAAVLLAVMEAATRTESVLAAIEAYVKVQDALQEAARREAAKNAAGKQARPVDPRRELAALDRALNDWQARQTATVKAQVAGIMAGADPAAYAALFGELAEERKYLEDRRGVVSRLLRMATEKTEASAEADVISEGKEATSAAKSGAALLEEVRFVLAAPDVSGTVKRDALGQIVERVICRRGTLPKGRGKQAGAEVVFVPGVFGEGQVGSSVQPSPGTSPTTKASAA